MDLLNREELERKLARIVGRDLRAELDRLMAYLGDPPSLANVPNSYWQNGWRDIQKDVEPLLLGVFLQQAEGLMGEIGIGVNWDLVNTTASQWSRRHTEQVLNDLFGTRYDHLNEIIPRFYEEQWNLGQLRSDLERYYSPVRAEMIAVTETTRAAVEGERALVDALQKESGIAMVPIWQTSNDERVCPICGPKHGKEITDGKFPPAHPRCRCWVTYEFPEGEGVVEEAAPQQVMQAQSVTKDEMFDIIEKQTGIRPDVKDYLVMDRDSFVEYLKSKGEIMGLDDIAGINHEGVIVVRKGYEDSALHEFIHSAGFQPRDSRGVMVVDININEGMTQSFTEELAKRLNIKANSGYTREVEWVNEYIIPLTGEDKMDVYRGYAQAEKKQKYLAELIWEKHGDKFSDESEWGKNVRDHFMHDAANYVGRDIYLEYLKDELGVLSGKSYIKSFDEKVKEKIVDGKLLRIIYITDYRVQP